MKILKALLPHITIVLCILFLVLWILDYFNPMMHFLTAALPKALLLVFIASSSRSVMLRYPAMATITTRAVIII